MNKRLEVSDLLFLMITFEIGTSVLFCLGIKAKQDCWLSILIAMLISLPITLMYVSSFEKSQKNLPQLLEFVYGKYIGKTLSLIYALYFLYIASRNVRDYVELSVNTIYSRTPTYIFSSFMLILVMYYLLFDICVLARVAKILLPLILAIMAFQTTMIMMGDNFSFSRLLPILENGIVPVIKAAIPLIVTFPFGELIAFTTVFDKVKQKEKIKKIMLITTVFTGLLLSFNNIIIISSLGADEASRENFPLYQVIRLINLGNLKNLDTLYVFIMIIGVFFKISVFTYAGLTMIKNALELKSYKYLLFPVLSMIFAASFIIADSYQTHILIGLKFTPFYIHVPLQIILPMITFLFLNIKEKRKP
ncbi:spore germination protein KB [Thermoanaerobacter thermohydrosulfuricus]|jgi:spore germination protein KB|uniref:Spore germination protein n=5 Tax=Thermoanaerobacter TaxID=1754 RepID=B0K745_THEP3|nr:MULTISPECIES: endospore germination permease [Thermoanaerobacter]ABY92310.1 spore germination protein [Thermoanaerobacter sp. X514]ABY94192.1 spore germination protein [Thermoanaerobacter pseudethanolicus ATCC 33223]ADD03052.1 spore germination protein [Thermoanaerobacter italicus Ab9]ADV79145.1 spore germination protein [Thermoanaerobacter brockii subsp. finnii Ako-1]EMT39128.1 spore germination protein (amino acid permease) [Thermoanaerobacter thermohydrosulfuricus WC1]